MTWRRYYPKWKDFLGERDAVMYFNNKEEGLKAKWHWTDRVKMWCSEDDEETALPVVFYKKNDARQKELNKIIQENK